MENIKIRKAITATLMTLLFIAVASASYWIYSAIVEVQITDYTLTIEHAEDGRLITFYGRLTDPYGSALASRQILIFETYANGTEIQQVNATSTNSTGYYQTTYTAPSPDKYHFRAKCLP